MTRKALVIGIDEYSDLRVPDLNACVRDANRIADCLRWHGDGSPNFETKLIVQGATSDFLHIEIHKLFRSDAETVVLYFAGHGVFDETADFGFIVTEDGARPSWGVNLATIMNLANSAYPRIKSTTIILDCCHAGYLGDTMQYASGHATIGKGVTIMTACKNEEAAVEDYDGVFTSILINGLEGQAADVLGNISTASLYAHVDKSLGAFEQRPLYKNNVQAFTPIRKVPSDISSKELSYLPVLFSEPDTIYPLSPECEPLKDRGDMLEKTKAIPFNEKAFSNYRLLQKLRKIGLVTPHEQSHMWHAAMYSTGCKLTKLGQHYYFLACQGRFGKVSRGVM